MTEERLLENTLIKYENSVKMMDYKHILKNPSKYRSNDPLESTYLCGILVLQYGLIFNLDIWYVIFFYMMTAILRIIICVEILILILDFPSKTSYMMTKMLLAIICETISSQTMSKNPEW